MGPDPAVAAVRLAVRRVLAEVAPGTIVLAACSGGADSLALAAALAFEAAKTGHPAGGVTVDHGLQEGSAGRAETVVRVMAELGLDPAGSVAVEVTGPGGPEAAARRARYDALDHAAGRLGGATVLLGHTLNDQAETVLLGLARGSGPRSLAGMPAMFARGETGEITYRRPFLDLDRATTRRACLAMGLHPWDDPHNDDPAFTRVRVRHEALPALEKALGPGIAEALARTARLARDDTDALDQWAADYLATHRTIDPPDATADPSTPIGPTNAVGPTTAAGLDGASVPVGPADVSGFAGSGDSAVGGGFAARPGVVGGGGVGVGVSVGVEGLEGLPGAVRGRVLRLLALEAGCPGGGLAAVHVEALDRLVTGWRGQGQVDLPGGVRAFRGCGRLFFRRPAG